MNALQQGPLESLCRKFLASRDSPDKQLLQQVERETTMIFDIILEVISSVYLLEPFRPAQVGHFALDLCATLAGSWRSRRPCFAYFAYQLHRKGCPVLLLCVCVCRVWF